jgi:integral membrane protein (TIGR01906 family)
MKQNSLLRNILGWIVTVLTPLLILMLSIRILITPIFAQVEYRMPGFPDDSYGFTLEDRLRWSTPSIEYLVNNEGIDYLAGLKFEDDTPIYNDNELSHMEDVKGVVTGMRIALAASMIILLAIVIIGVRKGWRRELLSAIRRGGWGVVGLIIAILLFVAISFDELFTWFHELFFQQGNWQFYTSDTLIRLFPMRFWQDAFIYVGVLSLIFGVLLIVFSRSRKLK